MTRGAKRRVELLLPVRTLLAVAAMIGLLAAFVAIGDTFLIVFVGIFLALVFEYPVRFVMRKTGMSRGLAATITVIGGAVVVTVLFLLLLVPLASSVRDFLKQLPQTVQELRVKVGLDPKAARILKDLFREYTRRGNTIMMSTHTLEVAEAMCDRVAIIAHGTIRAIFADVERLLA